MEQGFPDTSSEFADEGTAAHFLASEALTSHGIVREFKGQHIVVARSTGGTFFTSEPAEYAGMSSMRMFTVDDEMVDNVQRYVDAVMQYAQAGELLVEQRVDFSEYLGVPESFGTSDAVILTNDGEIICVDLKYGRGVRVDAERNEQLMLYALGALNEFGMLGDFTRVRMVIHQPRLGHLSEWDCTVDELLAFAEEAKERAEVALYLVIKADNLSIDLDYAPGEKTCQWCKAKATCPALAAHVSETVGADFETLIASDYNADCEAIVQMSAPVQLTDDKLGVKMSAVDLIEDWCKAVRAETERRLLAGKEVPGFKLVEGRRGHRKWTDAELVEKTMKSMRIKQDEMYEFSLISPTTAEKLHKSGAIGERQWPRLQELITQSQGGPSVAPASDKRPALVITPAVDDFADETAGEDLV